LKYAEFLDNDVSYLDTMPTEILMNIMDKLDCAGIAMFCSTNKTYRVLCEDKMFWIYYLRNRGYGDSIVEEINQTDSIDRFINICRKYLSRKNLIIRIKEKIYQPELPDSEIIGAESVDFMDGYITKIVVITKDDNNKFQPLKILDFNDNEIHPLFIDTLQILVRLRYVQMVYPLIIVNLNILIVHLLLMIILFFQLNQKDSIS